MNENLLNGQHDPMKPDQRAMFNGESSHSSRDSSPGPRQIPLLPAKMEIPPGQLPPRMTNLTGQMGRVSLDGKSQTPFSSPKVFTSTPVLESTTLKTNLVSPIEKPKEGFTHSSTSQFASVSKVEKNVSSFFNQDGTNGSLKDLRIGEDFNNVKNKFPSQVEDRLNQEIKDGKVNQEIKTKQGNFNFNTPTIRTGSQPNLMGNQNTQIQQQKVNPIRFDQHKTSLGNLNLPSEQDKNLIGQKFGSMQNLENQYGKSQDFGLLGQSQQQKSQSQQLGTQIQQVPGQKLTSQIQQSPSLIQRSSNQFQPTPNQIKQSPSQTQLLSQPLQSQQLQNQIPHFPSQQFQSQTHFQNQPFQSQMQTQQLQSQNQPQGQKVQPNPPQVSQGPQVENQIRLPGQIQNQLPIQNPSKLIKNQVQMPNLQMQNLQMQNQQQMQNKSQQMQTQFQSPPQIQPHLQQQMRIPPPKSNSFPQLAQNLSAPVGGDQNKAHLHSNRYPQRPNVGDQQNLNQNLMSGYQSNQMAYQNPAQPSQTSPNSGFQTQSSGFQTQPSSGFQSQNSGIQSQNSGIQSQNIGFQNTGYQNQYQHSYQSQIGFSQNAPDQYNRSVTQSGFNKLWGNENYDLLQSPNILPPNKVEPPKINLGQEFLNAANCSSDIFRCTMTKIPESTNLLQKSRLPLGVLIHPFKDLTNLPVIQCNTIVRCRTCRTYINPFVFFADSKRWKCNLCYRVNELPEEFQYDPVSKTYGDPSRRPEVRSSTIEYIAPAEYMLRPPQPAIYLYLFDVSRLAVESGYLHTVCNVLTTEIKNIPGDARTQIGFLCYDSSLHFYSLAEGLNQPHEMTVLDIDDIFIPCPDNLLVNLQDRVDLIMDLLSQLPTRFANTNDTNSALGAALQAAYKMTSPTGGRITVFQTILPNKGPGAVGSREDPNQRSSNEVHHLNPANDFYKRLALECNGQQVAVDLFILNSQYVDLATISGISRFSGGCIYHFPLFKSSRVVQNDHLERSFRRYVTRKIGFEAVMRIRCTRGLSIHTFHGNFFVRSTDLLSLPNINPDAGFGMQVAIEENLSDVQTICFQAALLYTSSKGERRIRVHTLCLPVANTLHDIINSADQQCIVGLLAKMAVDRSMQSSLSDAREAFLNVAIDILTSYKIQLNMGSSISGLMAPNNLKLLPLYISALLKSTAFRVGTSTRLDDRVRAMCDMKTKPLPYLIQQIYPDLYPVHNLQDHPTVLNEEEEQIHLPPHLQLTARNLDSNGAYLMDTGEHIIMFICANVSPQFLKDIFDCNDFNSLTEDTDLPTLNNDNNRRMHMFLNYLNEDKPFAATVQIIKDNSPQRVVFLERLIEDRLENSLSYHEFLQHIKTQVK